ncbi:MAG TPA: hypothetical protein VGE17_05175, partial [Methylophilus sp.]
QQHLVASDGGKTVQRFVYNNRNLLTEVEQAYGLNQATSGAKAPVVFSGLMFENGRLVNADKYEFRSFTSYRYDSLDRVQAQLSYHQQFKSLEISGPIIDAGGVKQRTTFSLDLRGALESAQYTGYTADGQVMSVTEQSIAYDENDFSTELGTLVSSRLGLTYASPQTVRNDAWKHIVESDLKNRRSVTAFSNFNAGGLAQHKSISLKQTASTDDYLEYDILYEERDSWLERGINGRAESTKGSFQSVRTVSQYNGQGLRTEVQTINDSADVDVKVRRMAYAVDGSLLLRQDGTLSKNITDTTFTSSGETGKAIHFSANGQYLGEIRKDGNSIVNQHGGRSEQASGSSSDVNYQVRRGDSLRGLALAFYGNADYWYLIANANGLTGNPDDAIAEGLMLDIPAKARTDNNNQSFKPMDLQQVIGDTTPALPYVPPPPRAGCNALAMVVMIAITVVATVATAGAAAGASGGLMSMMSTGASVLTGAGATAGLGAAVGMSAAWAGATAAAVGGFVGSVAGQLAGKAMGVVDSFSLKNAFASGLTAGATAGMGSWMGVGGDATKTFVTNGTLNTYGKIAMAASTAGISVGANKLAGNQASFQWRNVVTGAVTAGLMDRAGFSNPNSVFEAFNEGSGVISGFMDGIAGAAIGYGVSKGLYNEGSWNFRNVAQDSFGNALGNSIVSGMSTKQTEKQAERKGNEAFEKAKAAGMTDTQAAQAATDEMLSMLPPEKRRQLLVDNDGERLSINFAGKNGKVDRNQGGLSMSMAGDDFRSRHASLVDFISDEGLWGNNQMLGLATGLLDKRAAYYSYDSIAKRGQQAFEDGYNRGFVNSVRPGVRAQQQQQLQTARVLTPKLDGTYFFGGAGMDGGYIGDMQYALGKAGVKDVHIVNRNE